MIYWWVSLQSRRNFGERVLSIFLTKIMAAIFDFNGSGRLGREKNLYQEGGWLSKIRGGVEMGRFRVSPKLWQSAVRASWFCSKNTTYMKILPHKPTCLPDRMFCFSLLNNLTPKSDKHLISPNSITPKSKSMVMGIKEMITSSKFSWLLGKFSLQVP